MLRPISDIYLREGEPRKIWFTCSEQDLYIWFSEEGEIIKFEYSYDKPFNEKSLLWKNNGNYSHTAIDDGSRPGKHPSSPISLGSVALDKTKVIKKLSDSASVVPEEYLSFLIKQVIEIEKW